jgi:hypothetical protein
MRERTVKALAALDVVKATMAVDGGKQRKGTGATQGGRHRISALSCQTRVPSRLSVRETI